MKYALIALLSMCTFCSIVTKDVTFSSRSTLLVIYFQFDKTVYTDSLTAQRYFNEYAAMKELMDANPEIDLGINGYQNTKEHVNLSRKRAEKVKADLMLAGVPENRMFVIQKPATSITDSISEADRALTQRVVFTAVKK